MPLGTLDRTPPPFFRQGISALNKLVLCTALALFLMATDHRLAVIKPLRDSLATALLPVVKVLSIPVQFWEGGSAYLSSMQLAQSQLAAQASQLVRQSEATARATQLAGENARLRALLELRPALKARSQAAEVLYEAPDPYSHKLFIDRGRQHGILDGSPVINEMGVLGQVTRTYLLNAEVTLLVDKDAAIPVLNARTQHRSAAFGSGEDGSMELRFVAASDDVQTDDLLMTSGVDGIYPAGLAVARVTAVDRRGDAGFARISLRPAAQAGGVRHVLVLEPLQVQMPARPGSPTAAASAAAHGSASAAAKGAKP